MATVGVDGDAQARPELAEVRVRHDVREHAAPLVHLRTPQGLIEGFGGFGVSGLQLLPNLRYFFGEASSEMRHT